MASESGTESLDESKLSEESEESSDESELVQCNSRTAQKKNSNIRKL